MSGIFVIAEEDGIISELRSEFIQSGFVCSVAPDGSQVMQQVAEQSPDLLLVEVDAPSRIGELCQKFKQERPRPVMALVCLETLDSLDSHWDVDDFIVKPYDKKELAFRIKRLLHSTCNMDSGEQIRCDDLVINLAKCEVSVGNRLAVLTFREYELLRFLVSNRGRVFTRETLLNRVWGYDY